MNMHTYQHEYPGGWKLADENCLQYVRRHGPRTYELIQYAACGPDGLYEVYTDILCLDDYDADETDRVLRGFGYAGIQQVRDDYVFYDAANQVIAECLYEWYGSQAVESLCTGVTEEEAVRAVLKFILENPDIPEYQDRIEVSLNELAARMTTLTDGQELTFYAEADGDAYGAKRMMLFDADTLLINYWGGGNPYIIDLESDYVKAEETILDDLRRYCEYTGIRGLYVAENDEKEAKANA